VASERLKDPIPTAELNDLYVGVPPGLSSNKIAVIGNPAKSLLLMVVAVD
jgi:hypothetical protein